MINNHKNYQKLIIERNLIFDNIEERIKKNESEQYICLINRDDENNLFAFKIGQHKFLLHSEIFPSQNTIYYKVFFRAINVDNYPEIKSFSTSLLSDYDIIQKGFHAPEFKTERKSYINGGFDSNLDSVTYIDKDKFGMLLFEQLEMWINDRCTETLK